MKSRLLIGSAVLLAATSSAAYAELSETRVKELIGEYLQNNPEAIIDSLQAYQAKQEIEAAQQQQDAVEELLPRFSQTNLPYGEAGNPEGDVLVVEFFDYNCPACKMMFESLDTLMLEDKKIRAVFVEFPIFGPTSDTNAKLSMALNKLAPEKYFRFHQALMRRKGKINEEIVLSVAANLGVDKEKLRKEAQKPVYDEYIAKDREIAAKLRINGTPAIIVGDSMHNGALGVAQLKEAVTQARIAASTK